ncbi:PREDICTED: putative gustatory receptor 28b [Vollenhovia emeryi]|uniref:putative gustatory receptor 28b n=1 Tax=Vollenhovia emeryi TaxID=411798 RepID=UPI0005F47F3C|nr:PREDICTED: putative gustatory receptor 28b [Vollenhovia emeryi]
MMSSVRTLRQAVMPIVWLNCIFCMGIFEIPIKRPRYFLSAFYAITILTGYFVLICKEIHIFQKILIQEFVVFYFALGVNIFVAVLAVIQFWRKTEKVDNIIKRSSMADDTLEALGIKSEYQKTFRNILVIVVIWIVGMLTLIVIYVTFMYRDVKQWDLISTNICICFPIVMNSVVDLTFSSLISCVQMKFQKINTLTNNAVVYVNESKIFKIHNRYDKTSVAFVMANYKNDKDKVMRLIQTLRHLHLECTRIARHINRSYCVLLLLELAVHFTVVTTNAYCLYRAFFGQLSITVTNEQIITMSVSACIYSFKIILINWLCTCVSTEAYKTGEIIQSIEGSIMDDDMREEIHQFAQQIVLNELKFTATGFFTIDNTLTGKFFATVATYVVILIQINTSI